MFRQVIQRKGMFHPLLRSKWEWFELLECGHVLVQHGHATPKADRRKCHDCERGEGLKMHRWKRRAMGIEDAR